MKGGEKLELAGLEIDVIFTPGHSPGHVTYSVPGEAAIFSGDVLFQGSVGRTDLPGGDWATLLESIRTLVESHPPETTVYPGPHGCHHAGRRAGHEPLPGRAGQVDGFAIMPRSQAANSISRFGLRPSLQSRLAW